MVFEENLLQLLRNCPTCMRPCQIDTFEIGTLLSVKQVCIVCMYAQKVKSSSLLAHTQIFFSVLTQTCSNCVITNKWQSQPFIRDMPVGNLQLSAAVCFNGASFLQIHKVSSVFFFFFFFYILIVCAQQSSNNKSLLCVVFHLLLQVLSSLQMASICPRTFNHHQSFFLQPTILWQWRAEQQQIIQLAKQCQKPITLGGDMRADSPGLSLLIN